MNKMFKEALTLLKETKYGSQTNRRNYLQNIIDYFSNVDEIPRLKAELKAISDIELENF